MDQQLLSLDDLAMGAILGEAYTTTHLAPLLEPLEDEDLEGLQDLYDAGEATPEMRAELMFNYSYRHLDPNTENRRSKYHRDAFMSKLARTSGFKLVVGQHDRASPEEEAKEGFGGRVKIGQDTFARWIIDTEGYYYPKAQDWVERSAEQDEREPHTILGVGMSTKDSEDPREKPYHMRFGLAHSLEFPAKESSAMIGDGATWVNETVPARVRLEDNASSNDRPSSEDRASHEDDRASHEDDRASHEDDRGSHNDDRVSHHDDHASDNMSSSQYSDYSDDSDRYGEYYSEYDEGVSSEYGEKHEEGHGEYEGSDSE